MSLPPTDNQEEIHSDQPNNTNGRKRWIQLGILSAFILTLVLSLSVLAVVFISRSTITNANTTFRFGAIGDFEYGTRNKVGNKLVRQAYAELEKVVQSYNTEFQPTFVIEMGDMVESSGIKREKAKKQFGDINAVFEKLLARREYVMGNHDLRALTKAEVREVLGLADNHKYFDEGDWRFVIMDTNFDKSREGADMGPNHYVFGFVPESEFVWLEEALQTDRPIILFSHHPLNTGMKNLRNYVEMLEFLKRYPNIVLAVSGHDPIFKFAEVDDIFHLTVDNLANKDSLGSFATLEAHYNRYTGKARVHIEHYGPTRQSVIAERHLDTPKPWWMRTIDHYGWLPQS